MFRVLGMYNFGRNVKASLLFASFFRANYTPCANHPPLLHRFFALFREPSCAEGRTVCSFVIFVCFKNLISKVSRFLKNWDRYLKTNQHKSKLEFHPFAAKSLVLFWGQPSGAEEAQWSKIDFEST